VQLFNGLGSVLTTQPAYERLLIFSERLGIHSAGEARGLKAARKALSELETLTTALLTDTESILAEGGVNSRSGRSNHPGVVVNTSPRSSAGNYNLRIIQPARGMRVASDTQSSTVDPLGLSGTLILEGHTFELSTEESLADLAWNINEQFKGTDTGAWAEIDAENRLVLERFPAAALPLQLQDPDDLAEALGLLSTGEEGQTGFSHILQAGQQARIEFQGQTTRYDSNTIGGLIPGTTLELRPELLVDSDNGQTPATEAEIRIEENIPEPLERIERFVTSYNEAMQTLNNQLRHAGSLEGDRSVQASRDRLIRAVEQPVGEEENLSVRDIGLEVIHSGTASVSELTLRRLAMFDAFGMPPSPLAAAAGPVSVIRSLSRIGIRQSEDGLLEIDRPRLEAALRDNPEQVDTVLRGDDNSVGKRLKKQLDRMLDDQTGVLARRKRLFSRLQQMQRGQKTAGAQTFALQLSSLRETIQLQSGRISAFQASLPAGWNRSYETGGLSFQAGA
jgi:flagellar capping protein FliD